MKANLLAQARSLIKAARSRGAQGARVTVTHSRNSSLEWRDGKVDRVAESTRSAATVTLFVDGRYSLNTTSDLRPAALERFLDEIVAATRVLTRDDDRVLPDPSRYQGMSMADLGLFDPQVTAVSADQRRKLAAELEAAARSEPGADKLISVTSSVEDGQEEVAVVTSNGMEGSFGRSSFVLVAEATVRGEGDRKPVGWWYASTRRQASLPAVEEVGRLATRRALADIGAKPEKTGLYPCVIASDCAGRLLAALRAPLAGELIYQRRSFLADKRGKQVASPVLTVTDDPLLVAGIGSRPFDPEGMANRARPLFDKGVLRGFYLDTYYARKVKQEPTSATAGNLVYAAGSRSQEELVRAMGKGILVTMFIGGNSNPATGDFSFGIRGQWVENGKPVRPISEMNLSGNHLSFWLKLAELGNDPFVYAEDRCPSLRFEEAQFSGV